MPLPNEQLLLTAPLSEAAGSLRCYLGSWGEAATVPARERRSTASLAR
jgi:hypothetical protein